MQPVPVLVTGASGFLGAHLVRALLAAGCRVDAVSRRAQPAGVGNLRWWQADLAIPGESERVLAGARPEIVFHLASLVTGKRELDFVLPAFQANLESTVRLLAAASAPQTSCRRIVVAGHSAGGHLVGAIFAASRECFAFDLARIAGGVPISGLFDFSPMPLFSGNADFRLDAASARALDLHDKRPTIAAPLVVAVGGDESGEFIRQSCLLADRWAPQARELQILAGLNHFSVLEALAERGQPLHEATLALFHAV